MDPMEMVGQAMHDAFSLLAYHWISIYWCVIFRCSSFADPAPSTSNHAKDEKQTKWTELICTPVLGNILVNLYFFFIGLEYRNQRFTSF